MLLVPRKVKHRKWQTHRRNPKKASPATRGTKISFGSYGLKAEGGARINSNQIEAARKVITRSTRKAGKLWIRVFPDRPYTKKPAEVKMGKGKGNPEGYCVEVKAGRILFEVDGIPPEIAKKTLIQAGGKLPLKTRVISRNT